MDKSAVDTSIEKLLAEFGISQQQYQASLTQVTVDDRIFREAGQYSPSPYKISPGRELQYKALQLAYSERYQPDLHAAEVFREQSGEPGYAGITPQRYLEINQHRRSFMDALVPLLKEMEEEFRTMPVEQQPLIDGRTVEESMTDQLAPLGFGGMKR